KVRLEKNSVHFLCNYALMTVLKEQPGSIEQLCRQASLLQEQAFGGKLQMSLNSLVMEVLGHAYAYKLLRALRRVADLGIVRKLSLKACRIDCGNPGYDSNRWFWDAVGCMKPLVFFLVLPKNR